MVAEFGKIPPRNTYLPARIDTMHRVYGMVEGKTCKTCDNLISSAGYTAKTVYKCTLSKMSHSEATDWRVGWQACGKYIEECTGDTNETKN